MTSIVEEAERRFAKEQEAIRKLDQKRKRLNGQEVDLVRLSDVPMRPVKWLWPGRIPHGKITLIAGHPGLGKSQLMCSFASVVTCGGQWPVDRTECEPGSVIILSAEDDPEDTIGPRLEAAGAHRDRCHLLRASIDHDSDGNPIARSWDISTDVERLGKCADKLGDAKLIDIDPVSAYLGAKDARSNAQIRSALMPLAEMAKSIASAIVLVTHLNKGGGQDALMRVMDSIAFTAAARAAYLVCKDDDDASRRLFLPLKNNLGPDTTGLAYRIVPCDIGDGIQTSRVEWDSDAVTTTANEAMTPAVEKTAFQEAVEIVRDALAEGGGTAFVEDIRKAAKAEDISMATMKRAGASLGVKKSKRFGDGKWVWTSTIQH